MYIYRPVFIVALITFSRSAAAVEDNETGEVIFVNVLHRHGDRTPSQFYPNDPYQNTSSSNWPEGLGQLTNKGKKHVFELGQWLRKRYNTLLTDRYSSDIIYIQSTDKDRTLMSAECILAGMFPPRGVQVWSDDLTWQPIPVHTTPLQLDKVLTQPLRTPCPAYGEELQRVFTSDEKVRKLNATYSELLRWTSENSGEDVSLLTVYRPYDSLFVESSYNLTLPEWTKVVFPEPMQEANVYNYRLPTWTHKLARLTTGLLIQEMIQNMVEKVHNKTTMNVHVYSAHDQTIVNLLNPLGAFNDILVPYAACLMMELRVDSGGKHYVSLYYRNSTSDGPYLLTVEGCAPVCPLDTFIYITQPLIPEDWDEECRVPDVEEKSYLSIVLVAVVVVMVTLTLLAMYYYCHRRRSH